MNNYKKWFMNFSKNKNSILWALALIFSTSCGGLETKNSGKKDKDLKKKLAPKIVNKTSSTNNNNNNNNNNIDTNNDSFDLDAILDDFENNNQNTTNTSSNNIDNNNKNNNNIDTELDTILDNFANNIKNTNTSSNNIDNNNKNNNNIDTELDTILDNFANNIKNTNISSNNIDDNNNDNSDYNKKNTNNVKIEEDQKSDLDNDDILKDDELNKEYYQLRKAMFSNQDISHFKENKNKIKRFNKLAKKLLEISETIYLIAIHGMSNEKDRLNTLISPISKQYPKLKIIDLGDIRAGKKSVEKNISTQSSEIISELEKQGLIFKGTNFIIITYSQGLPVAVPVIKNIFDQQPKVSHQQAKVLLCPVNSPSKRINLLNVLYLISAFGPLKNYLEPIFNCSGIKDLKNDPDYSFLENVSPKNFQACPVATYLTSEQKQFFIKNLKNGIKKIMNENEYNNMGIDKLIDGIYADQTDGLITVKNQSMENAIEQKFILDKMEIPGVHEVYLDFPIIKSAWNKNG